jgi:hypothetical protein
MALSADEFLRRFLLHVLPDGFQRIRHYGLLGNHGRVTKLTRCRRLLEVPPPMASVLAERTDPRDRYEVLTGHSLHRCPVCHVGHMERIGIVPAILGRAQAFRVDTS